ncbi:MAG: hypothetical protein Q9202_006705 [Teloschistes flavicans]
MVLASPLDIGRRQLVVTLTVTTTSTAAASSSQPIIPIIPTAIPPYTTTGFPSGIVTASPVSNAAVFTPITHPPVPIIAQSLPGTIVEPIIPSSLPTSTGLPLEDPCQKISIATCLQNCQVIDGNAQLNAPGVVFPPEVPTTIATSTPSSKPTSISGLETSSTHPAPTYTAPVVSTSNGTTTDGSSDEEDGSTFILPLTNVVTEEEMEEVAILCQKMFAVHKLHRKVRD